MLKELKIYPSLTTTQSVGWDRDDAPLVHVFAQAEPGQPFTPTNGRGGPHWPCKVCIYHGYTKADFHNQISRLTLGVFR
jgi:hypothetical protein